MSTIAIVGAGCSGTLVAVQLARCAAAGTRVVLFERSGAFGPGLAYRTRNALHLLNVPAGNMSAFPDRPEHFVEWAQGRVASAASDSFLPRHLYGAYLAALLDEAAGVAESRRVSSSRRIGSVAAIEPSADGTLRVTFDGGARLDADAVVLALGNLQPGAPGGSRLSACSRFVPDPWADGALDFDRDEPVLLLGTGLTMLDVALALDAAGHRAPLFAASRRGLVPQSHRAGLGRAPRTTRPRDIDAWPPTARGLLRAVRGELALASDRGDDWRSVIAALRPDTARLWQSLAPREQRRFLEHLQPWWDTHRHRAAPATATRVAALRAAGRLAVLAGRATAVQREPEAGRVRVDLRLRDGRDVALSVGRVVDCTGSALDLRRVADPLVYQLLASGLARPDAVGIGIDSDAGGSLIGARGDSHARLFAVGPLRRGTLWENTAVPEIRDEARRLAERVAQAVLPRSERTRAVA